MSIEPTDTLAEIRAIQVVAGALEEIDTAAQIRVLRWANERYGRSFSQRNVDEKGPVHAGAETSQQTVADPEFATVAEFLAATGAVSEPERVLVVGYWFQILGQQPDLESQQISTELKHAGHRVSNITRAFSALMSQKPQLATQIRKGGNTKQARKKYKLTSEGISKVQRMLRSESNSDD